jgi:hypothetical protein
VEGGTTGFILQQILEKQKAFRYLDSDPLTILQTITDLLMQVTETISANHLQMIW